MKARQDKPRSQTGLQSLLTAAAAAAAGAIQLLMSFTRAALASFSLCQDG